MFDFDFLSESQTENTVNPLFDTDDKRVLVLGNSNEFVANAAIHELKQRGFQVNIVPATVDGANTSDANIRLYLVVMDRAEAIKDLLVYLKDIVIDQRKYVCILGNKTEISEIYKFIPPEDIAQIFERPIGVQELCDKIDLIYKKSKTDTAKRSILVIDDDPVFLRRTQKILKEEYKVYIANSGANGIMLLSKHMVDLILLDYEMPIVDGPHVFEMIKAEPELSDIPIMFLTGKSDIFSVQNALHLGPQHYIIKTTPLQEFLDIIAKFFLMNPQAKIIAQ